MLPETNQLAYFAELADPRHAQNRHHPLINIVSIAILGVISGADTEVDIEQFTRVGFLFSHHFKRKNA